MLLGAYPSALHVRWTPPKPFRPVQALAVGDEPTPFWEGEGEDEQIEVWLGSVEFRAEWGDISPAPRFNGPSGRKIREMVLDPLGIDRGDAWITDCLDLYHASVGNMDRVRDTYQKLAEKLADGEYRLPEARLLPHPDENGIVRLAEVGHLPRLRREIRRCSPRRVITLGNAALRVMKILSGDSGSLPHQLRADSSYGQVHRATVAELPIEVLPLAHPAAPPAYRQAHQVWLEAQ